MLKKLFGIAVCITCVGNFLFAQEKESTRSANVCILDSAFFMPQLNRTRRIWIYLPAEYCQTKKKYPVLYLHDGQNVFDAQTSFTGEWGVDEALDTLGKSFRESIVVAIDNGGAKRLNEYAPFDTTLKNSSGTELNIDAEGDAYVDFLVKTLQPFINKRFRTKRNYRHQYIAGSSMGGLISFYALLKYPKSFGGAGVFSPSFWIAPQIKEYIEAKGKKVKGKIYFYAGKQEGEEMVPDMLTVFEKMNQASKAKMTVVIRTEGKHNEQAWREEFPLFYEWMMGRK